MDPDLDHFVRIKPKNLQCQHSSELEESAVCLALSSDAQLIAAGTCENAITVYDLGLTVQHTLQGHEGGTVSLAFAKQGKLVSTGEDGHAAVWDCVKGTCLARLECEGEHVDKTPDGHTVSHAVCNPSGTLAACSAGRTLHLFDVGGDDYESSRRTFPAVKGGVIEDVRFVGDKRLLVSYYGGVTMFCTEPGAPGVALDYGTNILSVAATPSLDYVVGGCMDSCVHIWRFSSDSNDQTELLEYSCGGYMSKVIRVDFNAAGTAMASLGGTQNTVWDFTGEDGPGDSTPVVALGHSKLCTCQAWQPLPDSALLVTGGKDGRVLVFDTTKYADPDEPGIPKFAAPIAVAPDPQPDEVTAMVWSPVDPSIIYVGHGSGILRAWRLPADAS